MHRLFAMPVRAQGLLDVHVATTAVEGSAGAHYAQALGLFRKYGLNVELQTLRNGEAAAAAVVGGSADVGVANTLSLALAYVKGLGLRLIVPASQYVNATPNTALVVDRASAVHSARDLDGKTIGVTALGDLNMFSTEAWLERNGLDPKRVRFVEITNTQMSAALERGTVDAAVITTPTLAIALGTGRILGLPYGAIAERFIANAWYAKGEWIVRQREEARRFVRAVSDAQQWANKNREGSAKILAEVTKIAPEVLSKMTRAVYAERFEPGLIQPVIETAVRYKAISASFAATELYEATL